MTTIPGFQMIRALWAFRGFVISSVRREFNGKYRESMLGSFWAVANPLAMISVYAVVFGQIMRPALVGHENRPFAFTIYLCSGMIAWSLFGEMLNRLNSVFLEYGNLIKKASFPRICLPIIVALSSLLNFSIVFGLYLLFLVLIGQWPGLPTLALIPLLMLQLLFALGLGILLGTLNVFFRDIGQLTGVVLQFWFWLTPIIYTLSTLPEMAQKLIGLNPLLPLIAAYQTIFLMQQWPDWASLWPLSLLTLFLLWLGGRFFLSRAGEMVDEL